MLLDPGYSLSLRPMKYPIFYKMYEDSTKNHWNVNEVDFTKDVMDLRSRLTSSESHMIRRLVAFFATGDSIVNNNIGVNLYKHVNDPAARMYLSRQMAEEALHVQFYLTLLDTYIPDHEERVKAFQAVENIPSIARKADFCHKYMDSIFSIKELQTVEDRRNFIMNLIAYSCGVEGLFFFGAFAYVYYLRSKNLLQGLADGTNWVFRDETAHINFAFEVIKTARMEEPYLIRDQEKKIIQKILEEAVDCEVQFSSDLLYEGVAGLSKKDMEKYIKFVADQRILSLGLDPLYNSKNPFSFMEQQDVIGMSNFFERRVSQYQVGIEGEFKLDSDF